jgi:hypothetical protein
MGAYLDLTAANAILKELYPPGQPLHNLVYADNPGLALIPKFEKFTGKYLPTPMIYGVSQGTSANFANAQGNQSPVQAASFLLTRKTGYAIATLDNQTMLAAKDDAGAFIETAKLNIDGAIRSATLLATSWLFRSGTGSIGQSNAMSTGVITLTNVNDVAQFEVNQVLQAAATDGAAPRAALGYVIAVDRSAGTVTVSATGLGGAAGNPASWSTGASGDFLLVIGNSNAAFSGFQAWLPFTAPTSSDNFYGVNRSADTWRLGGGRYDGSSQPIEEAFIDASALLAREGGKPNVAITNFQSYGALEKALGAKIQYVEIKGPAEIAFRGIRVNGANSEIRVFPDRSCPAATGFLLQMDTWKLASLGEAPMILRYADGNEMLRVYNQDASEVRVGFYGNVQCFAPGWNANVKLSI